MLETLQNEVCGSLLKMNRTFDVLLLKHEELTSLIMDDNEFEREEAWLKECHEFFLKIDLGAKMYLDSDNVEISKTDSGMIRMQNENTSAQVNNLMQNMSVDRAGEITATMDESVNDEVQINVSN